MESTTHSLLVQYGPLVVISVAAISIGLLVVAGVAFFITHACGGSKQHGDAHGGTHH